MKGCSRLQLTLAILKPDLLTNPVFLKSVKDRILKENFWILKWKILQWQRHDAELFYQEHRGSRHHILKQTSITQLRMEELNGCTSLLGPIMPMVLSRDDAVSHWRNVMGPTKTTKAKLTHPQSIRGMFGLTDTRNVAHGSDSVEKAVKEMKFFFPDFNPSEWIKNNEEDFKAGRVVFDEELEIHRRDAS